MGLADEIWDDRIVFGDVHLSEPGDTVRMVSQLLETTPDSVYVSTLDLNITLLNFERDLFDELRKRAGGTEAEELGKTLDLLRARALFPQPAAFKLTVKPAIPATKRLGLGILPYIVLPLTSVGSTPTPSPVVTASPSVDGGSSPLSLDKGNVCSATGEGASSQMQSFMLEHGFPIAVKGAHHDCTIAGSWVEMQKALAGMRRQWGVETSVFLQRAEAGEEGSIVFAAYRGALLGALEMRKRVTTSQSKVWAATTTLIPRDSSLWRALEETARELEWTGGAEVEFLENLKGERFCIDWNPRFPAWIYGAQIVLGPPGNLPAILLEAAIHGCGFSRSVVRVPDDDGRASGIFMRTVSEVAVKGVSIPHLCGPDMSLVCKQRDVLGGGGKAGKGGDGVRQHPSRNTDVSKLLQKWRNVHRSDTLEVPGAVLQRPNATSGPQQSSNVQGEENAREIALIPDFARLLSALHASPLATTPSPRVVLVESILRGNARLMIETLTSAVTGTNLRPVVALSMKTNPSARVLAAARSEGMHAEAISVAELRLALVSGFSGEHLILNGPAKWFDTHDASVETGSAQRVRLHAVFADSVAEFEDLVERVIAGRALNDDAVPGIPPRLLVVGAQVIGVRLTAPHTGSRFGVDVCDTETLGRIAAALARLPASQEHAYHFHFSQSTLGSRPWVAAVESVLVAASAADALARRAASIFDLGGGWASNSLNVSSGRNALQTTVEMTRKYLPSVHCVVLEPGKVISERAGVLLTRVMQVREPSARARALEESAGALDDALNNTGRCIIVDSCTNEIADLRSHTHPIAVAAAAAPHEWRLSRSTGGDAIYGRVCMEADVIAEGISLPKNIARGDWVAIGYVGAYDLSMAHVFGTGSASAVAQGVHVIA
jgi:diaminopimelate decarboxylase